VSQFQEKPVGDGGWINGDHFVLEPAVPELIDGNSCTWLVQLGKALDSSDQLKEFASF